MATKHVKPVDGVAWENRKRAYPHLEMRKQGGTSISILAPTDGIVESIKNGEMIFKHKAEPYYSVFGGDNLKLDSELKIGDEVSAGVIIGNVLKEAGSLFGDPGKTTLLWRVGSNGNTKDWMDPEKWVENDFSVWPNEKSTDRTKRKRDFGELLLYGFGAWVVYDNFIKKGSK